jgi:RNA polymerase sigma-70 factor (ECF subfamily)
MLEDKLLVWDLKRGKSDALRQIYEKYRNELLALAVTLSSDRGAAEDVVHDVFVSFAEAAEKIELRTSLRSYLLACIANRVRNLSRTKHQKPGHLDEEVGVAAGGNGPVHSAMSAEQWRRISQALAELPYQQREVIVLRLQAGMKFKTIAETQGVSINTTQARYRYGLDRLRSLLNSEVEK